MLCCSFFSASLVAKRCETSVRRMQKTVSICLFYCLLCVDAGFAAKKTTVQARNEGKMEPKAPLRAPKCDFFTFKPFPSPTIGVVEAEIVNSKKVNETFKMVLNCPTLKILDEPKMSHTLIPGAKEVIVYSLVVNHKEIHRTPELVKHKCILSKWTGQTNTLAMCAFNVSVWPYGLFDYPCDDFNITQVKFERKPEENSVIVFKVQDSTSKLGLYSVYMMNIACTPSLAILDYKEHINKLRKGRPWDIEVPANCSGMLRVNYVGTCDLQVYNLCHTQKTLALNTSFQLYDGETDECEYLKERLGDLSHHPLAAFFGLNYVETGYLTVVVLIEVFLIIITSIVIMYRAHHNIPRDNVK